MAILTKVFLGAPDDLKNDLDSLIATSEILGVSKTSEKNKYIIVYKDSATKNQNTYIIKGAPEFLKSEIDDIVLNGESIDFVHLTDFYSHYLVVSRWLLLNFKKRINTW